MSTHRIGLLLWSPADIEFSPQRFVQPDLFVEHLVDDEPARSWGNVRGLVLAIEVLSPSTALADRQRKRHIYMEASVDEYWIVDLDAHVVERWRPDDTRPDIIAGQLMWQPRRDVPQLAMDLNAFFGAVHSHT